MNTDKNTLALCQCTTLLSLKVTISKYFEILLLEIMIWYFIDLIYYIEFFF